ncbi:MAG: acyltransferase family protein [Thermodesulfobacteriota bacterium]|nr:acyltransferase family protein [Thermodesulfobacteriota bacterium]
MHLQSSKTKYRADIDGVRALAVLSVFLFHLHPSLLPGGFLGVDVFFVISGYLITSIILREHHLRTFSFAHFYARRVKRIFPALFVVIILSTLIAILLLPPEAYINFMKSARYASGQLSNVFFARKVDYFDEGFSSQPLLHTWSLGVEEQFYLFWPFLIFLCFRIWNTSNTAHPEDRSHDTTRVTAGIRQGINNKIAGILFLFSLFSYVICYILVSENYNLAFYMFYTRVLEFCIGGFISLGILPESEKKSTNSILGFLGIFLLCYSFFFIKEEYLGRSFLQFGVVIPCIGTALIILANSKSSQVNRILGTRPLSYIGKISYSLYLFHWPVIIFWKTYSGQHDIGMAASLCIILISFTLSTLSYFLIEQPARKSSFHDKHILIYAILIIIVFASSFKQLEKHEIAPWRITKYQKTQFEPPKQYAPECRETQSNQIFFYECQDTSKSDTPIIALVGDSHAPHFLRSTTEWASKNGYNVKFSGIAGCPMLLGDVNIQTELSDEYKKSCDVVRQIFKDHIVPDPRVEIILIAQRFDLFHNGMGHSSTKRTITFKDPQGEIVKDHTRYYRDQLSYTVRTLEKADKKLVILKQVPIFNTIDACNWEPLIKKLSNQKRVCEFDTKFIKKWQQPSIDFINDFASTHQVDIFDPVPFFDNPLQDGINTYNDKDHLNNYGTKFLVPHFKEVMDKIIAGQQTEN